MENQKNVPFGFTLLELLIVLFLMGVLLTLVTPHFGSAPQQVRRRVNQANIRKIEGAVQLYRIDIGIYPVSLSDLVHCPKEISGWRGPYLKEIPVNPFNSSEDYQINSLGQVE